MQKYLTSLTGILAVIALVACGSPGSPAGGASSEPACALPDIVKESPEIAAAVQEKTKIKLSYGLLADTKATAHVSGCQEERLTRVDFSALVSVRDVTAMLPIGEALKSLLAAMDEAAPGLPGDVKVDFYATGQVHTIHFTRDMARQTKAAEASGPDVLAALGYPGAAADGQSCAVVAGRQPAPDLTRQVQTAFDRLGPPGITASVSTIGEWCDGKFTPRQTELHIGFTWSQSNDMRRQAIQIGKQAGPVIDTLRTIPRESLPGDLPPRLVMATNDWDLQLRTIDLLDEAIALRDTGLEGEKLYRALGFPVWFMK